MAVLDWLQQLLGGQEMPPPSIDQAPGDMSGIVLPYLQKVLSGEIARQGMGNTYDPSRSFAGNALDPRGIEQATNLATAFSGGGLGTRLKLGPAEPIDLGRPGFWHNLLDEQGNAAGHVAGWLDGPKAWIESMSGRGGANALGPEEVRGLLRQFRDAYPDVSSIAGERVTGARRGGEQNYFETAPGEVVSVPLRRKQ